MDLENKYLQQTDSAKLKKLGQFFTPQEIADFMARWVSLEAGSVLDPAVGNGIFFQYIHQYNPDCTISGYEIDKEILAYFSVTSPHITKADYLLSAWDQSYDAIICNPPYNRFQAIPNRDAVFSSFIDHTSLKLSGYTNQYVLFLIKSIFQMSANGRLAYLIPTEFLNSKYGDDIKNMMIKRKLLRAIINFNKLNIFNGAVTTSCILLLDKDEKTSAEFVVVKDIDELAVLSVIPDRLSLKSKIVDYAELLKTKKWRKYLNDECDVHYNHLIPLSKICQINRGIATGDNEYFLFTKTKIAESGIPEDNFRRCACRSADINDLFFDKPAVDKLIAADKLIYLLDIKNIESPAIKAYINRGEQSGVNRKYLPSHRTPWYSMEQKPASPIWISSANRNGIKIIRNLAGIVNMTTFHSVYIKPGYNEYTDILFAYLLTPVAKQILLQNKKEMGNGLDKFQPGDLHAAHILDLTIINGADKTSIIELYNEMKSTSGDGLITKLDELFRKYLESEPPASAEAISIGL